MGRFGIRKIIDELIDKYKTNVPSELAEYLGIEIKETYSIEDIACIFKVFDTTTILLNKNFNLGGTVRELVIAHELGHEQIGHTLENPQFIKYMRMETKQESEADYFAVYLMLHRENNKEQQRYVNSIEFENEMEYYLNKLRELRK